MALIDDYPAIAAELRRIQAERKGDDASETAVRIIPRIGAVKLQVRPIARQR